MNGPEHYAEAERLLTLDTTQPSIRQVAQVHATLALAAATMDAAFAGGPLPMDWLEALGYATGPVQVPPL